MFIRGLLSFTISLVLVLILMPKLIDYLKKISFNQTVSEYSLEEYKKKAKTPIMGGILFIAVPCVITLLCSIGTDFGFDTAMILMVFVCYGLIGFTDDRLIIARHNNDGLSPKQKFAMQILLAAVFFFLYRRRADLTLSIPFTGKVWNLKGWYFLLILLMFAGSSNAVNLTDGMDGLAAGCTEIALVPFLVFAIVQGRVSIAVFILGLMGALAGYLHYNITPAKIFMGDTGSLALGAVLAALAMVLKKELPLILIGGIFVVETLCVMIQIGSVKLFHRRVFIYTPIHYAFVKKGQKETTVVHRFWMVEALFAIAGLLVGLH